MKRLVTIAAAAAVLPLAHVAVASPCSGGSISGSHDSHSYGTSYVSSSPGYVVVQPACEDTTDVVGYRRCRKFGTWGDNLRKPHIIVEAGVVVRQFGSLLGSQTGTLLHGAEQFTYRVASPSSQPRELDTAVLSTIRAGVGLPHGLYTALEVDLGGLAQPGHASTEMMSTGVFGSPELQQRRGFVVDSVAAVGVHGAARAGSLGVEVAGGVRTASYNFDSNYHNCEDRSTIRAYAPIAEARARGELWLNPWLAAGVTVGTSLLESRTWMGGLYLGVHTRAFGGDR